MFTYSKFEHVWEKSKFPFEVPLSKDYKVFVNGEEIPVYTCRISAYPFNTWWPGHQRPVNQTEIVSYVNLVSDEALSVEVLPLTKTAYEKILLKPYSKGVKSVKVGDRIAFKLEANGGYVLELDDYHGCLYLFNNKPVPCENPDAVTYYFGAGVHFPGKISLRSGESVYVDKDALVYGCIFAEGAENIRVYGNGVFDDSGEERINQHCYEPYANGNVKFYDCKNVKIEGVGLVNSALWCVNFFHCFDVEMVGVNVFGQWRYNTDGVDIVNCQRVVVRNSFVHSFDDTVTVKGIDRYAQTSNTDILVENCVFWCDWGKTCEIGLETACREYKNIVFRNCDILRGGNTACDIQNGDYAEVYDLRFENIRLELESAYTQNICQQGDEDVYKLEGTIECAAIVNIVNPRFRDMYAFLNLENSETDLQVGDRRYAGVHDVVFKDITVYCDEKILKERGTKCVLVNIQNFLEGTEFRNITVENVTLNGKRLTEAEMTVYVEGKVEELKIR